MSPVHKEGPERSESRIVGVLKRIADGLQRIQALLWGGALAAALIAAAFQLAIFSFLNNDNTRAWIFLILSIVLVLCISLCGVYIHRLRKYSRQLESLINSDSEAIARQQLEFDDLSSLFKVCHFIDENLVTFLSTKQSARERLRRCVDLVMEGARDNVLHEVHIQDRRIAFLEYQEDSRRFSVLAHRGLTSESIRDVAENLTFDNGLAGRVLQLRESVTINDVDAPAAVKDGWVRVGTTLRHSCIAAVGVWLNDRPVGVICVDCKEKNRLTQTDVDVLESLTYKIRLAFAIFDSKSKLQKPRIETPRRQNRAQVKDKTAYTTTSSGSDDAPGS